MSNMKILQKTSTFQVVVIFTILRRTDPNKTLHPREAPLDIANDKELLDPFYPPPTAGALHCLRYVRELSAKHSARQGMSKNP